MCERRRASNDDLILFLCVTRMKGWSRGCEGGASGFRGLWNLNSMVNKAVWFLVVFVVNNISLTKL